MKIIRDRDTLRTSQIILILTGFPQSHQSKKEQTLPTWLGVDSEQGVEYAKGASKD